MAEPIATSVMTSLPRHLSARGPLLRVVKTASRPSFSANFFTPAPRIIPSHSDSPPLESVLDYRAWAYPISKPSLWREDGLMRSLLLSELSSPQTSAQRTRKAPQPGRIRSRKVVSLRASSDRLNFSTSPAVHAQLKPRPHVPLSLQMSETDQSTPLQRLQEAIQHRAVSKKDLERASVSYSIAKDHGDFLSMPPEDMLKFAGDLATFIDYLCVDQVKLDVIMDWGERLRELLEHIPSSSSDSVSIGDLPRRSLLSRAASYLGHLHDAQELFNDLPASPTTRRCFMRDHPDPYQSAFESFVLSMQRHEGTYAALTFLFTKNKQFSTSFVASPLLSGMAVLQSSSIKEVLSLATKWNQAAYSKLVRQLVSAFNAAKAFDKSLQVVNDQYSNGLTIHSILLCDVSQGLAMSGDVENAKKVFDLIPEDMAENDERYQYLKIFLLSRAKEQDALLEAIAERDVSNLSDREISSVLYPLSVKGLLKECHKAFDYFFPLNDEGKRTRTPNIYHYTQLIQAHSRRAAIWGVDEILKEMQEFDIQPNAELMTNLIGIYRRKADTFGVLNTFEYMRKIKIPYDSTTCTVVIAHLGKVRDSENATKIYMQAIADGIVPDEKMTNALMNAYVENGVLHEAVAIFHHLTSLDAERLPNIHTFNIILKGYVLVGAPFRLISRLFLRLQEINVQPDSHTYSSLVLSATDAGELEIAQGIYDEMKHLQDTGERKNLVTEHVPTILMTVYLEKRELEKAREILDEMTERGCRPTAVTYRAIINSYGRGGRTDWVTSMQVAEDFVKQIQEEDNVDTNITRRPPLVHYYSPLIINHCKRGDITEVERLYNEYLDAGGEPTNLLLQHLLHCYGIVGNTRSAMDVWEIMLELAESRAVDGGIEDDEQDGDKLVTKFGTLHYPLSMYTDIVSKDGLHAEVASTWTDLQSRDFEFDSHNWNHLAVALVRAGKVDRAFDIVESVLLSRGHEDYIATDTLKAKSAEAPDWESKLKIPGTVKLPPAEYPLRDLRRRLEAANSQKLAQFWAAELLDSDEAIKADFTYPLQILQIIPPHWNSWRPHALVLRTLLIVVLQLQRGYPIRPILSGEIAFDNVSGSNMTKQDVQATEALLETLYKNYPQTIEKVREFQQQEAIRLTHSQFEQIYMLR